MLTIRSKNSPFSADRTKKPFPIASVIGLIFFSSASFAACDNTSNPVLINSSCEDFSIDASKSDVTITPQATVSPFFSPFNAVTVQAAGNITGVFLNQGTITSGFGHNSFVNHGFVSTLTNEGTILNQSSSRSHAALLNGATIETLINKGTISATQGSWGAGAHAILQGGRIGTLNNAGTISAQNSAIYFVPGITARIETLINSGIIQGGINGSASSTFASAIELGISNSIGTLINTGMIDHSVCDAGSTCYAAVQNEGGNIDIITNLGRFTSGNTGDNAYGIINGTTGRIGTLNNAQNDLKYFGTLPRNYNTIINSNVSYGKLAVTSGTGQTTYGVAAGSTMTQGTTYAAVLTGVNTGHLANTTGTYGGGLIATNWRLQNVSGTQWDLITEAITTVAPNTGSKSGNKLGSAMTLTYVAAAAAPVPTQLTNNTPLVAAIQSLTPAQANSLTQVHAEGYSSNMTITLEQMGHIANTSMDRIHAPIAAQSGTARTLKIENGRHIWLDASSLKGTVKGYDNLAGFGYRLSNMVIGKDLHRDASGGFGVLGGIGYTTMDNPEQVQQHFSSTNYYVGLYGGQHFSNSVKLSGSAGYLYSDTLAKRNNPDIGHFTGGMAQNNYLSNGAFAALKLSRAFLVSGRFTVTPFAGVSYSQLWMKKSNESGGNDFNYTMSASSARSALTFVGSEFLMPLNSASVNPLTLSGFYRLGYDWSANSPSAHEITANSHLFGSFKQIGANKGPVNHLIGLGLQGQIARGVSVRAGVVGRISTHGNELGGGGEIKWML